MTVTSVLGVGAMLGEGPLWFEDALWFVDIKAPRVYRFEPASGAARHWDMPAQVGWVLPAADGGMIVGLQTGLHRFDPADGSVRLVHDPEPGVPDNRLNDATVDAAGRLWFGTMDNGETAATGHLYRCADGVCTEAGVAPVAITNGPAACAVTGRLYHVDTLGRTIWKLALADDGSLGPPAVFAVIEAGAGHPDGVVVDAEGGVWVGMYGGWAVRRYDAAGALVRTVGFPVANVTKIAFGGADLCTAYATTARKGLSAAALAGQPLAGNVFAFDAGVAGVKVTPARL